MYNLIGFVDIMYMVQLLLGVAYWMYLKRWEQLNIIFNPLFIYYIVSSGNTGTLHLCRDIETRGILEINLKARASVFPSFVTGVATQRHEIFKIAGKAFEICLS